MLKKVDIIYCWGTADISAVHAIVLTKEDREKIILKEEVSLLPTTLSRSSCNGYKVIRKRAQFYLLWIATFHFFFVWSMPLWSTNWCHIQKSKSHIWAFESCALEFVCYFLNEISFPEWLLILQLSIDFRFSLKIENELVKLDLKSSGIKILSKTFQDKSPGKDRRLWTLFDKQCTFYKFFYFCAKTTNFILKLSRSSR